MSYWQNAVELVNQNGKLSCVSVYTFVKQKLGSVEVIDKDTSIRYKGRIVGHLKHIGELKKVERRFSFVKGKRKEEALTIQEYGIDFAQAESRIRDYIENQKGETTMRQFLSYKFYDVIILQEREDSKIPKVAFQTKTPIMAKNEEEAKFKAFAEAGMTSADVEEIEIRVLERG